MTVEVEYTCPLGSKCTEIKDGKLLQCSWLVRIEGEDAQGNKHDRDKCAIAWQPILALEASRHNIHNTAAINSLRNDTIVRQDKAMNALAALKSDKKLLSK